MAGLDTVRIGVAQIDTVRIDTMRIGVVQIDVGRIHVSVSDRTPRAEARGYICLAPSGRLCIPLPGRPRRGQGKGSLGIYSVAGLDTVRIGVAQIDTVRIDTVRIDTVRIGVAQIDVARIDVSVPDRTPRAEARGYTCLAPPGRLCIPLPGRPRRGQGKGSLGIYSVAGKGSLGIYSVAGLDTVRIGAVPIGRDESTWHGSTWRGPFITAWTET